MTCARFIIDRFFLHLLDKIDLCIPIIHFFITAIDQQMTSLSIENIGENIPGGKGSHFPFERFFPIEVLKHVDIGVSIFTVGGNAKIRVTGKNFIVTGIGPGVRVSDIYVIGIIPVAIKLAFCGDDIPEKRQEFFSPASCIG